MAKRNRKRLRTDIPTIRVASSRFPYRQDSAWGARGCNSRSADSNGPGGGPTEGGKVTREIGPLSNQKDDHNMQDHATRFVVPQGS